MRRSADNPRDVLAVANRKRVEGLFAPLIGILSCLLMGSAVADEIADAWQDILNVAVDDSGRIDFAGLARSPAALNELVSRLANQGPQTTPEKLSTRNAALAFHINAYNILAMHGVIQRGIPENFSSIFKRARFFRLHRISVDGHSTTLHAYENDVIRKFREPRIHFLLNCMVRDCPRLPKTPMRAESLDNQLEEAAQQFFNAEKYISTNPEHNNVQVSAILDFYTEDFVSSGDRIALIGYINQYRETPIPTHWSLSFKDYDWTVNRQP